MATVKLLSDQEAAAIPAVQAVFDDIRATRKTDFINNFWRALANDPANLKRVWETLKSVMTVEGAIDPLTREMIYIAVSTANACQYCIQSHTAAARARGDDRCPSMANSSRLSGSLRRRTISLSPCRFRPTRNSRWDRKQRTAVQSHQGGGRTLRIQISGWVGRFTDRVGFVESGNLERYGGQEGIPRPLTETTVRPPRARSIIHSPGDRHVH